MLDTKAQVRPNEFNSKIEEWFSTSLEPGRYLVYYFVQAYDMRVKDELKEEFRRTSRVRESDYYVSKMCHLDFSGHKSSVKEFKRLMSELKPPYSSDDYFVKISNNNSLIFFVDATTGAYDLQGVRQIDMGKSLPISHAMGRGRGERFILKKGENYFELENAPKNYNILNPKTSYSSIIDTT